MLKLIELTFKHVENAAEMASKHELNSQQNCEDATANTDNTSQETVTSTNTPMAPIKMPILQLNADNMMPLTIMLILRAAIPHLGTEILLLEDLMGTDFEFLMHGFAGYCFTTIKAAYQHIIHESFLQ